MILTGKAERDFEQWLCRPNDPEHLKLMHIDLFYCKSPLERHSYYVEWLDSVGIFITIYNSKRYTGQLFSIEVNSFAHNGLYESRLAASHASIKLANEIYNGS